MQRHLYISIAVTVIAALAAAQIVFSMVASPNTGFAFNVVPRGQTSVVEPLPGVPLPAGLQAGDELLLRRLTPEARAALVGQVNLKAGLRYTLAVRRGDQILSVPVHTQAMPLLPTQSLNRDSGLALFFALLILALLVVWRGRDFAAWGLGLFAFAIIVHGALQEIPLGGMWVFWLDVFANVVVMPILFIGLYLMAYSLGSRGLSVRLRRIFSGLFGLFYVLLLVADSIFITAVVFWGRSLPHAAEISVALFAAVSLTTFALLLTGYARAGAEQRLRIRWILYSTGVLMLSLVVDVAAAISSNEFTLLILSNIANAVLLLAVAGYTYAVLRQRLVDVRIVLNRTLVYGVITVVVVGVFAGINVLVDHATFGHGASLLLELIVPLGLGVALDSLRKYLDRYLNRLVFRRQYRAETALQNFARTCGFIEDAERLLDATAQQVFEHSRAQSVALYERDTGGYQRVRELGVAQFPAHAGVDDMAFVRLRAGDHEADLHEITSALGPSGYLFAMAVRGEVIGALICGPRPAEHYTNDERALLFHVAQQAGSALHALRTRAQEKFVVALASGAVAASEAPVRARELLTGW